MRKTSFYLLLLAALPCFSQSTLQVGEKLSYNVQYGEENYDFTVKMKQILPEIAMDYALTSSSTLLGTVTISKKAQESATKMHNTFSEEEKQLTLQNEITVFPSQVMVEALKNEKEIQLDAGNGTKTFKKGRSKSFEIQHFSQENGVAKAFKQQINASELVSTNGSEHIWISTDLGQPVIVEMDLGWKISLTTWLSTMPLTDKPQELIGKAMSEAAMMPLSLRLAHSAQISIEDLSDPGKPYIEKEYFCPMEGIRIKTHNDTLTDILFYTEGFEHEGFIWRGYDGKFASGINLNMTYEQIDKTIGKPTTPRWSTDVLIQYPQQRMTVYYNMPNSDKNKKAIANAKIDFLEFE